MVEPSKNPSLDSAERGARATWDLGVFCGLGLERGGTHHEQGREWKEKNTQSHDRAGKGSRGDLTMDRPVE